MGDKKEPKNVKKLAADAAARKAPKEPKRKPTVAKRMGLRKQTPPPAKKQPDAVLKLITDALNRKRGTR